MQNNVEHHRAGPPPAPSRRSPSRSRYRSQPKARKQGPMRFLSPCFHNPCSLLMHFSSSSDIEMLVRASSYGAMISSKDRLDSAPPALPQRFQPQVKYQDTPFLAG